MSCVASALFSAFVIDSATKWSLALVVILTDYIAAATRHLSLGHMEDEQYKVGEAMER